MLRTVVRFHPGPPMIRLRKLPFNLPFGFGAICIGQTVYVGKRTVMTVHALAHELHHADQWAYHGLLFLPKYVWAWVRGGFRWRNNSFEKDAMKAEDNPYYLRWAERLLIGKGWMFAGR